MEIVRKNINPKRLFPAPDIPVLASAIAAPALCLPRPFLSTGLLTVDAVASPFWCQGSYFEDS